MSIPKGSHMNSHQCLPPSSAAALLAFAAPAFAASMIFVSNEKDNTVTVLNAETLETVKTIKVARRPRGIVVSPDGKEVFVAAGDGDIMDVIDTSKLEVTRQLESGPDPELMAVDPKGDIIYIANEDDSLVTIMDIKSGDILAEVPVGVEPEGMGVSPDGKFTVATSESTSMAHVIDNASNKLIANVLVDIAPARGEVHPRRQGALGFLRGRRHHLGDRPQDLEDQAEDRFEVPGVRPEQLQPVGMDFTKDGKEVFVALGPANRVAVIDVADQGGQGVHPGRSAALARRDESPTGRNITWPTASPTI